MSELGLKPILTFYRWVGLTKAFSLQSLSPRRVPPHGAGVRCNGIGHVSSIWYLAKTKAVAILSGFIKTLLSFFNSHLSFCKLIYKMIAHY